MNISDKVKIDYFFSRNGDGTVYWLHVPERVYMIRKGESEITLYDNGIYVTGIEEAFVERDLSTVEKMEEVKLGIERNGLEVTVVSGVLIDVTAKQQLDSTITEMVENGYELDKETAKIGLYRNGMVIDKYGYVGYPMGEFKMGEVEAWLKQGGFNVESHPSHLYVEVVVENYYGQPEGRESPYSGSIKNLTPVDYPNILHPQAVGRVKFNTEQARKFYRVKEVEYNPSFEDIQKRVERKKNERQE